MTDRRAVTRTADRHSLYEEDFYSWTTQQSALLRAGRLDLADIDHLAEEIETLGRSEAAALRSSYRLIAMHLLKLLLQPAKATAGWENTINRERLNVEACLADNPGLKSRRDALFLEAYGLARREASFETRLAIGVVPEAPPFSIIDVESPDYWPPGFSRRTMPRAQPTRRAP